MNRMKVHRTVEYIKASGEFNFDRWDVLDNVERVLSYYRIEERFTVHEKTLLKWELIQLAEARVERECARLAFTKSAP